MASPKNWSRDGSGNWVHSKKSASIGIRPVEDAYRREEGYKYEVTAAMHETNSVGDKTYEGRPPGSGSAVLHSSLHSNREEARKDAVQWMREHPDPPVDMTMSP